jgi:hypothetical protein
MMFNTNSQTTTRLPEILEKHEETLLEGWIRERKGGNL